MNLTPIRGNSSLLPSSHCPESGTANHTEVEGVLGWGSGTQLIAHQPCDQYGSGERGCVNPLLTYCIVVLSLVGWLGGFSLPLAALAVGGVSLVQPQHGLVHT